MPGPEGENRETRIPVADDVFSTVSALAAKIKDSLAGVRADQEAAALLTTIGGMLDAYLDGHCSANTGGSRMTLEEYNAQLSPAKGFLDTFFRW